MTFEVPRTDEVVLVVRLKSAGLPSTVDARAGGHAAAERQRRAERVTALSRRLATRASRSTACIQPRRSREWRVLPFDDTDLRHERRDVRSRIETRSPAPGCGQTAAPSRAARGRRPPARRRARCAATRRPADARVLPLEGGHLRASRRLQRRRQRAQHRRHQREQEMSQQQPLSSVA